MRSCVLTLLFCFIGIINSQAQYFFLSPKIVNTNYTTAPYQGTSIALSGDGNTMMIGAPVDSDKRGSVYVYNKVNGSWVSDTILAPDGHTPYQFSSSYYNYGFGSDIAMSYDGNTAIISRAGDNDVGAVWAFQRDSNGNWHDSSGRISISAIDHLGAAFGESIDVSDDGQTVIIGAPEDNNSNGAAYIMSKNANGWYLNSPLSGGGGALGAQVAISGNGQRVAVGAPNLYQIYVYDKGNSGWIYKGPISYTPPPNSFIGTALDLSYSGDTMVIGGINLGVYHPGAVTLAYDGTSWNQFGGNISWPNSSSIEMCVKISSDGKTVAMGFPHENNNGGGCAWTQLDANGSWGIPIDLITSGNVGQANQGHDISLSADGTILAVGAPFDNNNIGASYVHSLGTPQLGTDVINGSPFCIPTSFSVSVPFTTNITGGNYTAQLSDSMGSFTNNPKTIGSGTLSPIHATIPANTPRGSHYRIRVVYTGNGNLNNPYNGDPNATDLKVNTCWPQSVAGVYAQNLHIYPNPTNGLLHIDNLKESATYRIYNSTGILVQSGGLAANTATLNINLPTGLYFIRLFNNTGLPVANCNILIQH